MNKNKLLQAFFFFFNTKKEELEGKLFAVQGGPSYGWLTLNMQTGQDDPFILRQPEPCPGHLATQTLSARFCSDELLRRGHVPEADDCKLVFGRVDKAI